MCIQKHRSLSRLFYTYTCLTSHMSRYPSPSWIFFVIRVRLHMSPSHHSQIYTGLKSYMSTHTHLIRASAAFVMCHMTTVYAYTGLSRIIFTYTQVLFSCVSTYVQLICAANSLSCVYAYTGLFFMCIHKRRSLSGLFYKCASLISYICRHTHLIRALHAQKLFSLTPLWYNNKSPFRICWRTPIWFAPQFLTHICTHTQVSFTSLLRHYKSLCLICWHT